MTIKLLHTSDLHIDWRFEKFPAANRNIRRHEVLQTINYIADIAVTEEVQGIMIAGDLFHTTRVDRQTLSFVLACFNRLAEHDIKVVIIPGNHDPLTDDSIYNLVDFPENTHIFKNDHFNVYNGIAGVNIYGLPFSPRHNAFRILKDFKPFCQEGWQVAMVHGTFQQLTQTEGSLAPIFPEDIARSGLDYLALGHHHNYRDVSGGGVLSVYPGSPTPLSFNNTGERYVVLLELSDSGPKVSQLPIPSRPYDDYNFDMTDSSLTALYNQLNDWRDRRACVRVTLIGITSEDNLISAEQLQAQYRDDFFYFEVVDQSLFLPVVDLPDKSVRGIFISKILERLAMEGLTEEERVTAKEALYIGLTLLEGGSI